MPGGAVSLCCGPDARFLKLYYMTCFGGKTDLRRPFCDEASSEFG